MSEEASEWLTMAEARAVLGIGRTTMARLTHPATGVLQWHPSPLDGRVHLIARHEVEALLLGEQAYLTFEQTRRVLAVSEAKLRALVKAGTLTPQPDRRFARRPMFALADVDRLKAAGGTHPAPRQSARGQDEA